MEARARSSPMRRSWAQELTCPPARGSPEQQQRARVAAAAAMTAAITIESGSAPGNATAARRPEVVVIQGLNRRGYEYIGQTPRNALKVFHGSTSGFSSTLTFKTLILILLKLYFVFMLLRYIYWLPRMSVDSLPDALFEISEVILSLAAVAGAESFWSYKSNLPLLSTNYFEASEAEGGFEPGQGSLRPPSFWHGTLVRLLLFGHAVGGLSLYLASNTSSWMREDVAQDSSLEATLFCLTLIATTQVYMAMTIYTVFCLDVRRTMRCAAEELQRTYQFISHDSLRRLHWKWEQCCRYLADLSHNFLGFVCAWYCYLFVRAVSLITLLCTAVFSANGAATALTRQQLSVAMFELTYLVILCVVSDKLKATLLSPVEQLREVTLSRPTSEVAIHVEVQRFMYRIYKYLPMTLLKLSTWTKFALKTFGLVVFVLLVRIHVKKL